MTSAAITEPVCGIGPFAHPALFYRDDGEFLAATVPFVLDGLAAGEPVAVAVPPANLRLLHTALGASAGLIRGLDMTKVGRNPGRIIPGVLRAFADTHPTARVRIIGEPIWAGRSGTEYPACAQHEALINLAFAGRTVTILCPYDVTALDPAVIADAEATHPVILDAGSERTSTRYAPERVIAAHNTPVPAPPVAGTLHFTAANFGAARQFAADRAHTAGLGAARTADLQAAVNELVANSITHAGGAGRLHVWVEAARVVCQVADGGQLTDPLVGRIPVPASSVRGRGVLLVNHLADLVRIHCGPEGTAVTAYFDLDP